VPDKSEAYKLIRAGLLIDGRGGPPVQRGAVLIQGSTIRAAGPQKDVLPPEGAPVEVLDYPDKAILPGLVDCHVHLIGIGDGRNGDDLALLPDEVLTLQAAQNARAHLYSGVTTVRDCGAKSQTTFMLREAMAMGITPGPRLVLSGRPMAIIGGHMGYFGVEATGPDECRAAVRQLVKEGADFIKITATGGSTRTSYPFRPSFSVGELKTICEEAHKFGLHAAAHCSSSQGIVNALDAGVDTIIHAYYKEPDGSFVYRPEITERLARQEVFVNATLHQALEGVRALEQKLESQGLTPLEQKELDEFRRVREIKLDHVSRMRAEGVRLVCGSDSAWGYYQMGAFQGEVNDHVEVGMSPMKAIVSATSDSARSCWTDDQVGSLEMGKQADVLVVEGDPSQDISALERVVDVFQGGDLVDRGSYV
jgi:imidazolonepropionase-like amidohydrolase